MFSMPIWARFCAQRVIDAGGIDLAMEVLTGFNFRGVEYIERPPEDDWSQRWMT
jgi:hypothetical protein